MFAPWPVLLLGHLRQQWYSRIGAWLGCGSSRHPSHKLLHGWAQLSHHPRDAEMDRVYYRDLAENQDPGALILTA